MFFYENNQQDARLLLLLLALQPTVGCSFSVIFFRSALSSHCFLDRLIPIMPLLHSPVRFHKGNPASIIAFFATV